MKKRDTINIRRKFYQMGYDEGKKDMLEELKKYIEENIPRDKWGLRDISRIIHYFKKQ